MKQEKNASASNSESRNISELLKKFSVIFNMTCLCSRVVPSSLVIPRLLSSISATPLFPPASLCACEMDGNWVFWHLPLFAVIHKSLKCSFFFFFSENTSIIPFCISVLSVLLFQLQLLPNELGSRLQILVLAQDEVM